MLVRLVAVTDPWDLGSERCVFRIALISLAGAVTADREVSPPGKHAGHLACVDRLGRGVLVSHAWSSGPGDPGDGEALRLPILQGTSAVFGRPVRYADRT